MTKRAPQPVREPWPGSPQYWRSLEERGRADGAWPSAENAAEFPKGHLQTPPSEEALLVSRRGLLGAMASTLALVGAEGCRRPVERIVPYTKMPEDVIPGVPSHYSTVIQRRGDAVGVVVESHEGRPTKVEGNTEHPSSSGAADLVTQASILDLYDPERSTTPLRAGREATWDDFEKDLAAKLDGYDADQGARLRVLMPPTISPTVLRMRAALAQRFPKTRVHTWSATADSQAREGARIAYGAPLNTMFAYERAKVVVALDSDFLQTETGGLRSGRMFAAGRRLRSGSAKDSANMTRLYVVEPSPTTTGANADHRLRLPASAIERYAYALAAALHRHNVTLGDLDETVSRLADATGIPEKWLDPVAKDLVNSKGRGFIVVGSRQPARIHALVQALNNGLGAVGSSVSLSPVADPDELDVALDIKALTDAMAQGQVDTLVMLGGNPVYDAPADLGFAEKLAKIPLSIHASLFVDETSAKCSWHVPRVHEFEAWGDARALDQTVSVQQPLIAPLFGGRGDIEVLGLMAKAETNAHDAVRTTARGLLASSRSLNECGPFADNKLECRDSSGNLVVLHDTEIDPHWKRGLASGVIDRPHPIAPPVLRPHDIADALSKAPPSTPVGLEALEVTFAPCPKMEDGRHANNTWLQETPDPVTKLVWDNAAFISPATAKALGVQSKDFTGQSNADVIQISVGSRSIKAAVWVLPGQADNSIGLTLGWGRTAAGRIGNGRGFDAYPLRTTDGLGYQVGAKVTKTADESYRLAQTQEHDSSEHRPIAHEATLAEYRMNNNFAELQAPPPRSLPLWSQQDYSQGHQWGMVIDLNACTGCSACVVACTAENNVPVVGKTEVWRGREMHWIRIDRYWVDDPHIGATAETPAAIHEPVMCVHCEEAPCENVCPVNATTHGPEGLNEMVYNRCIGTRYCGNNCPYKVRRFNYLNWHNDSVWKETGGLPQTLQMQQNPNVTVRFRGVMEKCTYCVQRIQSTKIRAKRELRPIRDREIQTACQQTCPADAITFGDLNDSSTMVSRLSRIDRRFGLLEELGTRPRTTYLGKVRNPNPEMV
jgi:Fe-S-cluster-containing dehydrogenase component